MGERLQHSEVELVDAGTSDVPPPEEAERLRGDLARLFPEKTPRRTLRVVVSWSEERKLWRLVGAMQHIAQVAYMDRTNDVAERLEATGHRVAVEGQSKT